MNRFAIFVVTSSYAGGVSIEGQCGIDVCLIIRILEKSFGGSKVEKERESPAKANS